MKAILALFIAAAAAQTTTSTALSAEQTCLNACAPGDVNCQAICVGVPHPGAAQMNSTTSCVAECDQGDGSTAASNAYAKCRDACISSYIILSGTAAPGGAYTTAIPPGVSTTAAAASASASGAAAGSGSASSGTFTTATFLIPVCNDHVCRYEPPRKMVTIEVYPFPTHKWDRIDFPDCDGTVTLTDGDLFSYLNTATTGFIPTGTSGSCIRTHAPLPSCTMQSSEHCTQTHMAMPSCTMEPSGQCTPTCLPGCYSSAESLLPSSQIPVSSWTAKPIWKTSVSGPIETYPRPLLSPSDPLSGPSMSTLDGKHTATISQGYPVGAPKGPSTGVGSSSTVAVTASLPPAQGDTSLSRSDLPYPTEEPAPPYSRPSMDSVRTAPTIPQKTYAPADAKATFTSKQWTGASATSGQSSSGSASGATASKSANAGNAVAYTQYGLSGGLVGSFLGALALL